MGRGTSTGQKLGDCNTMETINEVMTHEGIREVPKNSLDHSARKSSQSGVQEGTTINLPAHASLGCWRWAKKK